MSDRAYDILNKIQRWIVALGVAYLGLSAIWGLPFGDEINQSIVVISTFLATILEISTGVWQKSHAVSVLDLKDLEENEDESI